MADNEIAAALAGQPVTPAAETATPQTAPQQEAQPQVNYVTSEQLNASMDEIRRMIQSSTDKSYNRVQKMIDSLKQAGIQNPTFEQAQKMLAQQEQDQSATQSTEQGEAQPAQQTVSNPEAEAWIKERNGDPTQDYWFDIYDAAKEAGVDIILKEDPEYSKYFLEPDGQLKQFPKPRPFVRAFEQAFAEKAARLNQQAQPNMASSPAMTSGGGKSNYRDPRKTSGISLISEGLRE